MKLMLAKVDVFGLEYVEGEVFENDRATPLHYGEGDTYEAALDNLITNAGGTEAVAALGMWRTMPGYCEFAHTRPYKEDGWAEGECIRFEIRPAEDHVCMDDYEPALVAVYDNAEALGAMLGGVREANNFAGHSAEAMAHFTTAS